ncbi:MAG: OmpA family protein [Deltaproteobacteria bacterium]|nr:OmpA family protein [Deltaproteobacteria bacterium]
MSKVLIAVVIIGAGAGLLGWDDLFHLTVGLPLLVGASLFFKMWEKRMQLEEGEEESEEEEGLSHQVFVGVLGGSLSLLLLAGGFFVASRLGLSDLFYGRDCPAILNNIHILEDGRAYERIVQITEERLQHQIPSTCREELTGKKVHARLAWAEQLEGEERFSKLRQARQETEGVADQDLKLLVATKLQAEEQKQVIAAQQQKLDENKQLLEKLQGNQLLTQETERGVVINLPDVLFEPGKADLNADARTVVKKIADILNHKANGRGVLVEGYTDSVGDEETNQKLSEDRARSIARDLVEYGVSKEQLAIAGYGKSRPIAPNDTPAERAKNRRVEVIIQN